jgi:hypothetical protein
MLLFYLGILLCSFTLISYHEDINFFPEHLTFDLRTLHLIMLSYLVLVYEIPSGHIANAYVALWNYLLAWMNGVVGVALLYSVVYNKTGLFFNDLDRLFAIFKIIEFGDTLLLRRKQKAISFLHIYHHISVFYYSMLTVSHKSDYPETRWFAVINAFVHVIMYEYYALRALQVKLSYAKWLTVCQIVQMVFGMLISGYMIQRMPVVVVCSIPVMGLCMYSSYFVLFLNFYLRRYMTKA